MFVCSIIVKSAFHLVFSESVLSVCTSEFRRMEQDNSTHYSTSISIPRGREKVIIVFILSTFFLYVNGLLIFTFFKKDYFRTKMRYIFFAHAMFCDCVFLFLAFFFLILIFFNVTMPVGICLILCYMMDIMTFTSPLSLTAMSLERYVAICMPLRHSEISTVRRAFHCIIIIHAISSIEPITMIVIFIVSVPHHIYTSNAICQIEVFIIHTWQQHLRVVMTNMYFLVMFCVILFSYGKITQAAKRASSTNGKSAARGLKTVTLHGLQLLLSLIQLWCPFVEQALFNVDIYVYMEVRYFDYIVFMLSPRCLCPLVYGLRDEKFFMALKHYVFCVIKVLPTKT